MKWIKIRLSFKHRLEILKNSFTWLPMTHFPLRMRIECFWSGLETFIVGYGYGIEKNEGGILND